VQIYALPAGTYLIMIGYLEHHFGSRKIAVWIDRLAILLVLGSSFWQSLGDYHPLSYATLMGMECLAMVFFGSARRLRRYLYAGLVGLAVNVVAQLVDPLLRGSWIVFLVVGLVVVIIAVIVERKLEQVKEMSEDVRRRLEAWE
jgi:hypothetical protein